VQDIAFATVPCDRIADHASTNNLPPLNASISWGPPSPTLCGQCEPQERRKLCSSVAENLDPVIAHGTGGRIEISGMYHQAAWEYADAALHHAHIYVHFKAVYTLALKQGLGEGDGCHVGGARKLFHSSDLSAQIRLVEMRRDELGWMWTR
jgi:hypothetical protein